MSRPKIQFAVGEVLQFKHPADRQRWGETATITKVEEVFTGTHPGSVFQTWLALVSANGTKLQRTRPMIRTEFQPLSQEVSHGRRRQVAGEGTVA